MKWEVFGAYFMSIPSNSIVFSSCNKNKIWVKINCRISKVKVV